VTDRITELEQQIETIRACNAANIGVLEGKLIEARMEIENQRLIAAEYKEMYDTKLNFYLAEIAKQLAEIERTAKPAEFYLAMQKIIMDTPALHDDWQRLCLMMNLSDPGFSKL
jgi:paraquat-inducible protein B